VRVMGRQIIVSTDEADAKVVDRDLRPDCIRRLYYSLLYSPSSNQSLYLVPCLLEA